MTKKKCDYEYEHDNLHIHKNKCEKCKYYLNCHFIEELKADAISFNEPTHEGYAERCNRTQNEGPYDE